MTTEDDFHKALDANPDDHQTRLVFADWLQERGDPRAEGYRALGTIRVRPQLFGTLIREPMWVYSHHSVKDPNYKDSVLPYPFSVENLGKKGYADKSRRELEDRAAIAFSSFSHERKQELLGQQSEQYARRYSRRTVRRTGRRLP